MVNLHTEINKVRWDSIAKCQKRADNVFLDEVWAKTAGPVAELDRGARVLIKGKLYG